MRISFQKGDVLESVQRVQSVVTTKTTLSILSNLMIETAEDHVVFTGTDLQVGVTCKTTAKIQEAGGSTIPVRMLSSILRELPGENIELAIDDKDVATITSGSSFFKILGISKAEYPKLPEFSEEESFSIEQKTLGEMLHKTVYSVSREDSRYALMGLYFLLKNKELTLVATDGRRLSKMDTPIDIDVKYKKDFIVPLKAVEELSRMLGTEGELKVFLAKNQVAFDLNDTRLMSRLIDGAFPDYERVIPDSSQERVKLPRQELASIVRMAGLMTTDQMGMVKFKFESGKLTVTSYSPEVGEARADMPVEYKGKDVEIGFNPVFVRDVLSSMEEEEVILEFTDSLSPGVVRGEGAFIHVIMPMRLLENE